MKAENLAIIFTPCIFRSNNKKEKAQDSLASVAKQTECITLLIEDQLQRLTTTLAEIDTLDTACHTASTRLSSLRYYASTTARIEKKTAFIFVGYGLKCITLESAGTKTRMW